MCHQGFTLVGNECGLCDSKCDLCEKSFDICEQCKSPYYLLGG